MALTRNRTCVIAKVGRYRGYRPGDHAAMALGPDIDLRIFPRHWAQAFAVEAPGAEGLRRPIQVFDAAGDVVHKIHLRARSDPAAWRALRDAPAPADQADAVAFAAEEGGGVAAGTPAEVLTPTRLGRVCGCGLRVLPLPPRGMVVTPGQAAV